MGKNFYEEEIARAEAHEKELQRQLGMDDGVSQARPRSYGGGFTNNAYSGYNSAYNNAPQNYPGAYGQVRVNGVQAFRRVDPSRSALALRIIGVIFIFTAGLMIGVMMIVLNAIRDDYERCTEQTQATVVENIRNGSGSYNPVFRYEVNGKIYTEKSSVGNKPAKYQINETVTLHYDPSNPKRAYVEKQDGIVLAVLVPLGTLFGIFGILFIVLSVKMKHKARDMMT